MSINTQATRRGFVKGAAISGAAVAGLASTQAALAVPPVPAPGQWSWSNPPEPVDEAAIAQTTESDVVIVGAGIAGVTCALRAAELGLSVTVIEKMTKPSGRGGGYTGYQTKAVTEAGIVNAPKADILERWLRLCGNRVKPEQVMLYLDRSGEVLDWIADLSAGELAFVPVCTAYRGELYKEEYGWELARAVNEFEDKPGDMTNIVYWIWQKCIELGVNFVFECPAKQLEKDADGHVTSVIASCGDETRRFVGTKGIVMATGDISGDREMIEAYGDSYGLKATVNLYSPAGANTGDGHKMMLWAGGHMQPSPICTMMHPNHYVKQNYFFLFVNAQGKRFMNEDTYIQAKSLAILDQPGEEDYAWSVFDSKWAEEVPASLPYGGGQFWDNMVHLPGNEWSQETAQKIIDDAIEYEDGYMCDTLEELAECIGVDVETFLATVQRYNDNVANGEDVDYHKRVELLTSISEPPFYALKFGPALLCMPGGIMIDTRMRVLDENDDPIEGLYAIGNCSGGRYAVDYPLVMNGNSHGSAMTWGYLAAEDIASK